MIRDAKITLSNGESYKLNPKEDLDKINKERLSLFLFNNGEIYEGYTEGRIDEYGDFCLSKPNTKFSIGLPYNRLIGWAYKK